MAWRLFLDDAWRIRIGGMGTVVGLDLDRAERRLTGAGVDIEEAADLLSACEIGFVTAANEKDEDGQE